MTPAIFNSLIDSMWPIFLPLSEHKDPLVFDAFLLSLEDIYVLEDTREKFTKTLYNKFQENKLSIPTALNLFYLDECLYGYYRKYDEAICIFQSILGQKEDESNIYQTSYHYNFLSTILYNARRYEEALPPLKRAITLETHPQLEFRLACLNLRFGKDVEESLKIMEDTIQMSNEDMRTWPMKPSDIKAERL